MREIFRKSGFFILGIFSLLYVIFARNFAEIHLQIPFLNFPIFVGEMILFICLILSFFVFKFYSIKVWQWAAVFYFVFVIAKALWGYLIWGPLAFRHAALFYYPIFIFFGFIFYKSDFLTERLKIFISFLILSLCISGYFYSYWILSLWVIAFILMRSLRHRTARYFFYTALLLVIAFSFRGIILTSRTFIVGNVTALIFLTITLLLIAKIKVFYKAAIAGSILILLAILIFKHSSINESGTIFDIKNNVNLFRASDAEIKIRKLHYVPKNLKEIKLFNPEQPFSVSPAVTERPRVEALKKTEEAVENKSEEKVAAIPPATGKPKVKTLKKTEEAVENKSEEKVAAIPAPDEKPQGEPKTEAQATDAAYGNTLFRLFIWRDMFVEFSRYRPILGFSFGKPFRSESLEIMNLALGEWLRDGWIEPHNSYLNILYRAGILGIFMIGLLIFQFCSMIKDFVSLKSLPGVLLCSILIIWLTAANFMPILELPYNAIPFWSLWGVALGYLKELKNKC